MKAELHIGPRGQISLEGRQLRQPCADQRIHRSRIRVDGRGRFTAELQVQLMVTTLGHRQVTVEPPMGAGSLGASNSKRSQERASIKAPASMRSTLRSADPVASPRRSSAA